MSFLGVLFGYPFWVSFLGVLFECPFWCPVWMSLVTMVGCEISGVLLASHKHALVTLVTMVGCGICGDLLQGNAKVCIGQGFKFNW